MAYRFLDHTADLAVEIEAASLEELFTEAIAAFTASLIGAARVEPRLERRVELRAPDRDRLLVRWLEEALVAFDVDRFLAGGARVAIAPLDGAFELRGALLGEPLDAARHPLQGSVKAVSYHGLHVAPRDGGWAATVVFDI